VSAEIHIASMPVSWIRRYLLSCDGYAQVAVFAALALSMATLRFDVFIFGCYVSILCVVALRNPRRLGLWRNSRLLVLAAIGSILLGAWNAWLFLAGYASGQHLLRFAHFWALGLCATQIFDIRRDHLVLRAFLAIAGAGIAISAPFLVVDQPDKFLGIDLSQLYSGYQIDWIDSANPNPLAGALAIVAPMLVASTLDPLISRPFRYFQVVCLAAVITFLFILQSRGAILGAAIACLFVALSRHSNVSHRLRFLPLVFVAAGLGILFFDLSLLDRFNSSLLTLRGANWQCGKNLFTDFLFSGVGFGNFQQACSLFYPELVLEPDLPFTHSFLLQVGVDLGVFGLAVVVGVLGYAVCVSRAAATASTSIEARPLRSFAIGISACIMAGLVHGLVDAVPWGVVKPAPLFWFIVGLAIAHARRAPDASSLLAEPTSHLQTQP
jgi:O-Antigen ligase